MICCKSNDAVAVKGQAPSSIKSQPPSSNKNDYGGFFSETKEQTEPTKISPSKSQSSEGVSTVYVDPAKSKSADVAATVATSVDSTTAPQNPSSNRPSSPVPSPPPLVLTCSSDDISTVYEEPPKVPESSFVLLPDAPQRGYEPFGNLSYEAKEKWKETRPYRIGTLVWYRNTTDPQGRSRKFKWYIPGVIDNLIYSAIDKNEVVAYKIKIEDSAVPRIDKYYLDLLNNAEPENVMLRWNEKVPPCPVEGIHEVSETRTAIRFAKLVEEYGDDLGFQGAKQNGIG